MSIPASISSGPAFLRLMKRYVVDYTNAHNQAVTADIMEPEYSLQMGGHLVGGRDTAYAQAARRQMDQFPGLGLTVHEIWTSGERLVMRFSEHGASLRHGGNRAAWGGIGLYRWNGTKLLSNMVEQDYFSRAEQLQTGLSREVEGPAVAPWDTVAEPPDEAVEEIARDWLVAGSTEQWKAAVWDDGLEPGFISQTDIAINDLFSCGRVAAFHASQRGSLTQDFGGVTAEGQHVTLHMAGILHIADGRVAEGRVIRNRMELARTLKPRPNVT